MLSSPKEIDFSVKKEKTTKTNKQDRSKSGLLQSPKKNPRKGAQARKHCCKYTLKPPSCLDQNLSSNMFSPNIMESSNMLFSNKDSIPRVHQKSQNAYEKKRIIDATHDLPNFDFSNTPPCKWLVRTLSQTITHRQYAKIYPELKIRLQKEYAPTRNTSRCQAIRNIWFCNIWSDKKSRKIVKSIILKYFNKVDKIKKIKKKGAISNLFEELSREPTDDDHFIGDSFWTFL